MTDSQRATLLALGKQSAVALATHIIEHWDELAELAAHRAEHIGAEQYGNRSYRLPTERLEVEVNEELADALFYQHLIELQRPIVNI